MLDIYTSENFDHFHHLNNKFQERKIIKNDPWLSNFASTIPSSTKLTMDHIVGRNNILFPCVLSLYEKKQKMINLQQTMNFLSCCTYIAPDFLHSHGLDVYIIRIDFTVRQKKHQCCSKYQFGQILLFFDTNGNQIRYPKYIYDEESHELTNQLYENTTMIQQPTCQGNPFDIIKLEEYTLAYFNNLKEVLENAIQDRRGFLASGQTIEQFIGQTIEQFIGRGNKLVHKDKRFIEFKDNLGRIHRSIMMTTGDDGVVTTTITDTDNHLKEMQFTVIKKSEIQLEGKIDPSNSNFQLIEIETETPAILPTFAYGYKVGKTADGKCCIIQLQIPEDARIAIELGEDKLRTDKAKVLSIWSYEYVGDFWKDIEINTEGNIKYLDAHQEAYSCVYDQKQIKYITGQICIDESFDPSLESVCVPGIHFCWLRATALEYHGIYNVIESDLPDEPSSDNTT